MLTAQAPCCRDRLQAIQPGILATSRHLERWHGKLAASSLILDRNRLLRQRDEAKSTSGGGSALADAADDMEGEHKELRNAARSFLNVFGIFAARTITIGTTIVKAVTPIVKIGQIVEWWWGDDDEGEKRIPWEAFLHDAARRAMDEGGRPPRTLAI